MKSPKMEKCRRQSAVRIGHFVQISRMALQEERVFRPERTGLRAGEYTVIYILRRREGRARRNPMTETNYYSLCLKVL